jgi:hypothetical protein
MLKSGPEHEGFICDQGIAARYGRFQAAMSEIDRRRARLARVRSASAQCVGRHAE